MKTLGYCLLGAVFITALSFFSGILDVSLLNTFGVRKADVQRRIFEQSQSYNEGMLQDLEHLAVQYEMANGDQKLALKALVIHRFEIFPQDKLTPQLRHFYSYMMEGNP